MAADPVDEAYTGLETIKQSGEVPQTRMATARAVQDLGNRLLRDDIDRSNKRAKIAGLVDGNAPYNWRRLREAGRGDACNVTWGTARANLEAGDGAYYDLFSQAPGIVQITTCHGTPEQRVEWSRIMSEELDRIFVDDDDFDNDMQLSQQQMVLFGCGPFYFENEHVLFPMSIENGDLLVPSRTRSKTSRWEVVFLVWDYYPPELYGMIENATRATQVGWKVDFTKQCIANAMDVRQNDGIRQNWEKYQNELKSNSYAYRDDSKVIKVFHCFFQEFDGKITHCIVERMSTAKNTDWLFRNERRYNSFAECVHPMYMDRGRGGYHHAVTGLGVKMYGPMEYENRLLCNLMDKAFSPKILLKPGSAEAKVKLEMARFGDYGVLPAGTEAIQTPVQGLSSEGLMMFQTSSQLMRSNLSSYRQTVEPAKPGNPNTAFQERKEATEQSSLSATTFNRYYKQLDGLYKEIGRRACNLNTTDKRAQLFQERCQARKVPRECFGRIESIKAVRVVGAGSPFMRQESLVALGEIVPGLPESGQENWKNDVIAANAGFSAVQRYNPKHEIPNMGNDQLAQARNQTAGMKIGVPPVPTESQDSLVYANEFLGACGQAADSLQQGADPHGVLAFLNIAAPAAKFHIQRAMRDPFKRQAAEMLDEKWTELAGLADKLTASLQKQAEAQQEQQQKTQGAMSDEEIKQQSAAAKAQLAAEKQQHSMGLKTAEVRQKLALNDAQVANQITNDRRKAEAEAAMATANNEKE